MSIDNFVGKVVVDVASGKRYILRQITAPYLMAWTAEADAQGNRGSYCWCTINGDPISNGILIFEDVTLNDPFMAEYNAHCHTRDAYFEEMGYWMRKS